MENAIPVLRDSLTKPTLLLFDVYETLLDMTPVEKKVNGLFDNRKAYQFWFERLMEYCFVDNCIEKFNPFVDIARSTLQMTANSFNQRISDGQIQSIIDLMRALPVHEGVEEGLSNLADHNFRLAALTNIPREVVLDRMSRTGLISYFEKVLSAEQVKKYKPCKDVYIWALRELATTADSAMLISSHTWDIAGALNAGMEAAFIGDDTELLYSLAPNPTVSAKNLLALSQKFETVFG